jgi:transcriptional regulator with XRE-family HTH domain
MLVYKLRLQKGWSQEQLADLSGLSVRTIQRIENGQAASVESLKSLASVFEVDFNTLKEPPMSSNTTSSMPPQQALNGQSISNDEILAIAHVRKLKGFYSHLIRYIVIVSALAIFNFIKSPAYFWVVWVALGWGLGVLFHGLRVFQFSPFDNAEWEKKQVEKYLNRKK